MKRSHLRVAIWLLIIYVVAVSIYLMHQSFSLTIQSLHSLQQGETALLTNPQAATIDFQASQTAAEMSLGRLRQTAWWNRLLTTLPPVRWQVELAKASYALAQAGESTISLQQSLSQIVPSSDNQSLISTGNQYLQWYQTNSGLVSQFASQITTAKSNLAPIPPWIFLDQADNFRQLSQELTRLDKSIGQEQTIANSISNLIQGSSPQTIAILFLPKPNQEASGSIGLISSSQHKLSALTFEPLTPSVLAIYTTGEERNGFWPTTAQTLATQTSISQPAPEVILTLSPYVIQQLLALTGTIDIPGVAGLSTSSDTWLTSNQNAATLVPALVGTILQRSDTRGESRSLFNTAIQTGDLQLWSANLGLAQVIAPLADMQPPGSEQNWLRLLPENSLSAPLNLTIGQTTRLSGDTLQTVTVTSGQALNLAPHLAVPYSVAVQTGGTVTTQSGYDEVTMQKISTTGYQVSYLLPRQINAVHQITDLAPLSGSQTVSAFGKTQTITKDTVLTP